MLMCVLYWNLALVCATVIALLCSQIMEIPSKLFYKNKLTCRAEFPATGPQNVPPLKFVGVDGQEAQEEDSPSYYNNHEALKITEQVRASPGVADKVCNERPCGCR